MNESTDTSGIIEFSNLNTDANEFVIGVEFPDELFDFDKFNFTNFKRLGIPDSVNTKSNRDTFVTNCTGSNIITNKQVCMLMGNILTTSDNMTNTSKPIDEEIVTNTDKHYTFDEIYPTITNGTNYSAETMYYGTNPPLPSSPFYDIYKDNAITSISAITPTFTSTTFDKDRIVINIDNEYSEAKYGNDFAGDAWLFRPRGYLYITGRKEYFESSVGKVYFTTPWLEDLKDPKVAFSIAIDVWKNKKIPDSKTSFEVCKNGEGGANIYSRTLEIVGNKNEIEKAFNKFENVLLVFGLKDDFQLD